MAVALAAVMEIAQVPGPFGAGWLYQAAISAPYWTGSGQTLIAVFLIFIALSKLNASESEESCNE